jgi:hypothetical protein
MQFTIICGAFLAALAVAAPVPESKGNAKPQNPRMDQETVTDTILRAETDALLAWAQSHEVDVPSVGALFEGTADYEVYKN